MSSVPSRCMSDSEMIWSWSAPGVRPPSSMFRMPVWVCVKFASVRIAGDCPGASVPLLTVFTLISAPSSDVSFAFCSMKSVPRPLNVAPDSTCDFLNRRR